MKFELRLALGRLGAGVLVWSLCAVGTAALPQKIRPHGDPSVAVERTAPLRRRVLLIGIDGCRPDALPAASTPHLDRLIREGAYSDDARAVVPTLSGPNWSSLLTGVAPAKHGVFDNSFSGANFVAYPHFFAHIKERSPSTFTASITQWAAIHTQIVSGADVSVGGVTDTEVALQATSLIVSGDPQVIFLHMNEVDAAGHAFGFSASVPEYIAAIETADARVGAVLAALDQRTATGLRRYEDWLIAVTTDHGGLGQAHGGNSVAELRTFLILSGLSIVDGSQILTGIDIFDIPVTLLDHLGIEPEQAWDLDGASLLPGIRIQ